MIKSKAVKIVMVFALAFTLSISNVHAEKTLGDLKNDLAALKKEKADNENAKAKTQSEINAQNNNIANAYGAIEQAETDIEIAKQKIEDSNNKIDKFKEESSKLLVFYEMLGSNSDFLEYISGASTMTDLIVRADAVSQILSYNENKLKELTSLIEENKQLQVDLKKKEEDLSVKITEYESSLKSLKNDLSQLAEITLDINDQIKAQNELIKYYEDIGCKDNEYLSSCMAALVNNSRFLRPTTKGYISSDFGYRSFYLNGRPYSDYHNAVDVAGLPGGTEIYAATAGTVAAVIRQATCGGNQVYIHTIVNGEKYTVFYAHMLDVYVKVGDTVTIQDVIGTLGGGGRTLRVNGGWDTCSTGYHLHFGIAKGFYLGDGYSSYASFIANSIRPPQMPKYGTWYYSRY